MGRVCLKGVFEGDPDGHAGAAHRGWLHIINELQCGR